jgi:hypothetical protein
MADPDNRPDDHADREPESSTDIPAEEEGETYELADDAPPTTPAKNEPAPEATEATDGDSHADPDHTSSDEDEQETYELAEEPTPQKPPKPSPPPATSSADASKPADKSASTKGTSADKPDRGKPDKDKRKTKSTPPASTSEQALPSAEQPMLDKSGKPLPKQWSTEEPEFVDPEVARQRREEQRKRAAEEEAIRAAKATRIKLAVLGVLLLIAAAVVAYFSFVR